MRRNSFSSLWFSEQGPTLLMDRNLQAHKEDNKKRNATKRGSFTRSPSSDIENQKSSRYGHYYGSTNSLTSALSSAQQPSPKTIRFQVVVWSIDRPDVTLSRVSMKFRVTLYWNVDDGGDDNGSDNADETSVSTRSTSQNGVWVMQGRSRASLKAQTTTDGETESSIDVPPLSIINAESFQAIGTPDVSMLREDDKLMRWTCLYRATLRQNSMKVRNFPHDEHTLTIQLGILQQRHKGGLWDRNKWRIALATEDDSLGSTSVPHGLLVDSVAIPEFMYNKKKGMSFDFAAIPFGNNTGYYPGDESEQCLEVSLDVCQDSGYYDTNIIPLFTIITLAAIAVIAAMDAEFFFQRGLLLLNCAFVEVGQRTTIDSRLPRVRYQIKMQRILNSFFYMLFFLEFESAFVYLLTKREGWSMEHTDIIDWIAILLALGNTFYLTHMYYKDVNIRLVKKRKN